MKIAVILGQYSVGSRPLDFHFNNIMINPRGLTGTDLATVMISSTLVKRGHDVSLFTIHAEPHNKPTMWEGVKLYNLQECPTTVDDTFDAILSINEPDVFQGLPTKPLRICWQFLNDFLYCKSDYNNVIDNPRGFDHYVDKWLAVCLPHMNHLKKLLPSSKGKWGIVGLGCSPEWYQDQRVPGRVVWTSSADRGLHWLLQEWPKIRAAVPYATLKIFYHMEFGHLEGLEPDVVGSEEEMRAQGKNAWGRPPLVEMGQRIRYIKSAIKKLKPLGVEYVGSVCREQLKKELNEASVLGYCCDTAAFSEGFSVSILEAHASFTVPIITDKDCLGEVYKNSGALIVESPIKDHLSEYSDLVIKALTDQRFSDHIIDKCRIFAMLNSWDKVAEKLEGVMREGKGNIEEYKPTRFERLFTAHVYSPYTEHTRCGPGSSMEYTESIRKNLVPFFKKHNINSILDCPCGDCHWMNALNLEGIKYIGGDVVDAHLASNEALYPNKQFIHIDITEDPLPTSDLLFCRDCLFHFSKNDKLLALHNFIKSDIKYIMISNYPNCKVNVELNSGDFKEINWAIEPFNFDKPLDILDDSHKDCPKREMNLYSKKQIEDALLRIFKSSLMINT